MNKTEFLSKQSSNRSNHMANSSHAKWLRQAALEIAEAGHNGWGNTCLQAADHIDALEGLVEAAFREGYSAGNSAGQADMIEEAADKTECWNISRAKAALTNAEETEG